ncbi:hypothetical protein GCM10008090_16060 [Arenicella chitinivorans]|uniref:Uncharacterized protein n=2 Tax=Arenicella chitinivorans TaxID=1329800 RepID=A0A918RR85_9GAMM|nr:hypothetical protein GCM10008090_16060 [Arenicella chitinivorans]
MNPDHWNQGYAVLLPRAVVQHLASHASDLAQTEALVTALLEGDELDAILDALPYQQRLGAQFAPMGSMVNEGDDQEIDTLLYDAIQGEDTVAEDLWMKVSWLSFYDADASLRFRFSFGVDLEEDVAADPVRQRYAAELATAVFPESAAITNNLALSQTIRDIVQCQRFELVERIVYFNGPDGGAYLHHDLERGHAGVVYAQLSGETYWLALPKFQLVQEIQSFITQQALPDTLTSEAQATLRDLSRDAEQIATALDSFAHTELIHLINETEAFVQHLIQAGYGFHVRTGDVILLPQADQNSCCWHTVFCLGEEMGQALSFAIRRQD